jgi:hypothetical protein
MTADTQVLKQDDADYLHKELTGMLIIIFTSKKVLVKRIVNQTSA